MTEYFELLRETELFRAVEPGELPSMLNCLQARVTRHKKGEILLAAGDRPEQIGIVLSGRLQIVREDAQGVRSLLAALEPPEIFAEALCCAEVEESPVTVLADSDALVLHFAFSRLLHTCPSACDHHQKLIGSMLRIVARKNLYLQNRVELIRTRSIRAKVLGYLGQFSPGPGQSFEVPLNREQMADFLCVERSALSHQLIQMKRDGLIDYRKNRFTIL